MTKKNSGKRKAERQAKVQQALQKVTAEKLAAKQEATCQKDEAAQAKARVAAVNNKTYQGTRQVVAAMRKAEKDQWKAAEKEAKVTEKEQKKRAKLIEKEEKQLAKQVAKIQEEPDVVEERAKKRLKRNDVGLLELAITPRKKVELDGDAWKPPIFQ